MYFILFLCYTQQTKIFRKYNYIILNVRLIFDNNNNDMNKEKNIKILNHYYLFP